MCIRERQLLLIVVAVVVVAATVIVAGDDTIVCCSLQITIVLIKLRRAGGQSFVFGGVIDNVVINCRRVAFLVVCSGG